MQQGDVIQLYQASDILLLSLLSEHRYIIFASKHISELNKHYPNILRIYRDFSSKISVKLDSRNIIKGGDKE